MSQKESKKLLSKKKMEERLKSFSTQITKDKEDIIADSNQKTPKTKLSLEKRLEEPMSQTLHLQLHSNNEEPYLSPNQGTDYPSRAPKNSLTGSRMSQPIRKPQRPLKETIQDLKDLNSKQLRTQKSITTELSSILAKQSSTGHKRLRKGSSVMNYEGILNNNPNSEYIKKLLERRIYGTSPLLEHIFEKISLQLAEINHKHDQSQAHHKPFNSVLILVIDELISEKWDISVEDAANKLRSKLNRDENFCDIHKTFFFRDQSAGHEDTMIMNKREENPKEVRTSLLIS